MRPRDHLATRGCGGVALLALTCAAACASRDGPQAAPSPAFVQAPSPEQAGRYLFLMGGCNDCHTPGWAESNGKLPDTEWGVGSGVGYRGPWGTTYPMNLRLSAREKTEQAWVQLFREGAGLPPMPWQNYRDAPEQDLLAIQRFLRSLGARGKPAPEAVPPGQAPKTPYIDMTVIGARP